MRQSAEKDPKCPENRPDRLADQRIIAIQRAGPVIDIRHHAQIAIHKFYKRNHAVPIAFGIGKIPFIDKFGGRIQHNQFNRLAAKQFNITKKLK